MSTNIKKIGQQVKINSEQVVETYGGKTMTIRMGDKGFIDSKRVTKMLTGEARGRMLPIDNGIELVGYDVTNITELIYERLNNQIDIEEMLEDNDIDSCQFKNIVADMLDEILR